MSPLVSSVLWSRMKPYLFVIPYDKDGGHADPRVRIEFRDLPDHLSHEAQFLVLPCITCQRPSHPLRRREGDGPDRLYYAPACPIGVRVACSRSAPAHEEYERFKSMDWAQGKATQLSLF